MRGRASVRQLVDMSGFEEVTQQGVSAMVVKLNTPRCKAVVGRNYVGAELGRNSLDVGNAA